jgi:hypothetical protein
MRIEFSVEGGLAYFPGLSKPRVIDSATLDDDAADRLRRLVDAARVFQQPAARRAVAKGAADYRQYTITVVDGRRRRTIHLSDPIADSHLQALVDYLRANTNPPSESAASNSGGMQ